MCSKIQDDSDKQNPAKKIEDANKKIPNTKNSANKTAFKATDIENKIPNISNLGTKKTTVFENKVFDITSLTIKADFKKELQRFKQNNYC